jgi:NTP pyrophosphatase (non-canonical NTP hydrolase)
MPLRPPALRAFLARLDSPLKSRECASVWFKSIRKSENIAMDPLSHSHEAAHEVADVFLMLCAVANRSGVAMEKAFREKEEINKKRVWVTSASSLP